MRDRDRGRARDRERGRAVTFILALPFSEAALV